MTRIPLVLILALAACTPAPQAQAIRVAPHQGYQFVDARTQGPFEVQRWVSAAAPDVSPAGTCDCLLVVYQGARRLLTLGTAGDVTAITIDPVSGGDINGDHLPELVVSNWSGGVHCLLDEGDRIAFYASYSSFVILASVTVWLVLSVAGVLPGTGGVAMTNEKLKQVVS